MGEVDIKVLQRESNTLFSLINATNRVLDEQIRFDLKEKFETSILSNQALQAKAAMELQKAVKSGQIETVVIGGAICLVGYIGAIAIDTSRKCIADAQARRRLLSYYKELTAKNMLIVERQQSIISKYLTLEKENEQKRLALEMELKELGELLTRIMDFRSKVEK